MIVLREVAFWRKPESLYFYLQSGGNIGWQIATHPMWRPASEFDIKARDQDEMLFLANRDSAKRGRILGKILNIIHLDDD